METAPVDHRMTFGPCGCEVHQRQRRRRSSRTTSTTTTMTDLQRRLLAGKAGLLELALLRETQRRLVEETVRKHGLESSNEDQRGSSKHLRAQSSVSDSNDESRSWSTGEESDEVFESTLPDESRRSDRTNAGGGGGGGGDTPTERTRRRCMSELHCRSTGISAAPSPDRSNSSGRRHRDRHRHRCRSEGLPDPSDAGRTVHLSAAYMGPLVFSGLTYDFPSPLHAVLTQFDFTKSSSSSSSSAALEAPSSRTPGGVGDVATFLGTLKLAFDEPEATKRLKSGQESSFSVDEKSDSTRDECVETRPREIRGRSQVVISEPAEEAHVSKLEEDFRENLNIKGDEQSKDIGPRNQLLIEKIETSEEFLLSAEFSRSSCHRRISESEDSNNNNNNNNNNNKELRSESSDDRTVGTTTEEDSPQKTFLSGLLREEGYFSSNDSLTSIAPEPPSRKRRKGGGGGGGGGGLKATRPICSEASFSDSLASDSCEDSTPREIENADRETKTTRTRLLSDFDADDRTPIFC